MPHFFINSSDIDNNKIYISDKENYKHIAKALRIKKGKKLLFVDENQIQYETVVSKITSNEVIVEIENHFTSNRSLPFGLYLAQSPLRSDAQSFVIEKATELGVKGVYPVVSDNCAVSTEIVEKKIVKWQKIMREASKQCERVDIPTCYPISDFETLIKKFDKVFVFCERIATKTLKEIDNIQNGQNILVIVGPEGGFSKNEFDLFKKLNVEMITLGSLILRAETAIVVGLGNIIYEFTSKNK